MKLFIHKYTRSHGVAVSQLESNKIRTEAASSAPHVGRGSSSQRPPVEYLRQESRHKALNILQRGFRKNHYNSPPPSVCTFYVSLPLSILHSYSKFELLLDIKMRDIILVKKVACLFIILVRDVALIHISYLYAYFT